jgi:spermidine synthase
LSSFNQSAGTVGSALALAFLLETAVLGVLVLTRFYSLEGQAGRKRWRWFERWAFTPSDLGGVSNWRLLLISIAGLFLELLMIRWISSEVRIFAYFKNFVLIACFLGFGLGCYISRRSINVIALLLPLITLAVFITLPWPSLRWVLAQLPTVIGSLSGVDVWGVPSLPSGVGSLLLVGTAIAIIVPLFALIVFVFVPIGQMIGWYLENAPNGLRAYSINVAGSLVGILLYTAISFLAQPPPVWFVCSALLFALVLAPARRLALLAAAGMLLCAGLASLTALAHGRVLWSPYQKLTITAVREGSDTIRYELNTNDSWYQQIVNLSPAYVSANPGRFPRGTAWNAYNIPYRFAASPRNVLVLGAGTGNDVAAALRNGADHVVAVEIDPLILRVGQDLHFEQPYSSSRVRVVVDDARAYLQGGRQRFDMILFSLLDSHTTSSHFTNIRIDNYVYTREALEAARRLLTPDGLFVVKFQVNTPWIGGRLYRLLEDTFGRPPLHFEVAGDSAGTGGRFFVSGSDAILAQAAATPGLPEYTTWPDSLRVVPATPTTDNWPYFYQHEPGIPASVLLISLVLVLLGWRFVNRIVPPSRTLHLPMFLLGAGFLLLEAQIVSKMALLFGTTWVVNSIVIAALLSLILAGNAIVMRWPKFPVVFGYAGILATALMAYGVPVATLLHPSVVMRILLAALVLCLPVLFAGIVFARTFAESGFRADALGANLLGALVGGLLESLSLWTGLRSLLVVAVLFYVSSWLFRTRALPGDAASVGVRRPAA